MKKKVILTLFLLGIGCSGFAQGYSVKWSELEKSSGRLLDIKPINANDFYALRTSGRGGLLSRLEVSSHKNLEFMGEGKLELRAPNGSPASYEGSRIVKDQFVVFLSDKQEGENKFFFQKYDSDLEPAADAVEIASYTMAEKRSRYQGSFDIIQSQNLDYITVVWTIPGRKEEQTTYGFKTFNSSMEEVRAGEYEVPFQSKFSSINTFYLSDSGDLFVSVTEYQENNEKKALLRSYKDYKAVHIFHISEDEVEQMTIDMEGKRIEAMTFNSDNDKIFVITGIYGEKGKGGVQGLFFLRMDFNKDKVLAEGFEEFSQDFIMSDWSDRAKEKLEKKQDKGKDVQAQFYNYVMREVVPLEDGSIVGSMEQYYVRVVSHYNAQTGQTTYTYYYYYNDIIAFKVNPSGGFEWLTKINKYQVTSNDGGYFSSYVRFVDGTDKMCFIFNDNVQNYDDSGDFIDVNNVKVASLSKKKNTVAICQVDLKTGDVEREMFFDRSELGAVAVPKLSNVDYKNHEVLLYAIKGKLEKFGIMNF